MTTQYWLVKQEPSSYSWNDFRKDGTTAWEGVRNYAARNHLRGMKRGDEVLFYASGETKAVVGLAKVTQTAYDDPTADEPGWVAVKLKAGKSLPNPVTLAQMKSEPRLTKMVLLKQSRLSVSPVAPIEFRRILELGS